VESSGANSPCEFDWMRPQAAILIAFAKAKALFNLPTSTFHFPPEIVSCFNFADTLQFSDRPPVFIVGNHALGV